MLSIRRARTVDGLSQGRQQFIVDLPFHGPSYLLNAYIPADQTGDALQDALDLAYADTAVGRCYALLNAAGTRWGFAFDASATG